MTELEVTNATKAMDDSMASKGWVVCICPSCKRVYYAKPGRAEAGTACGWGKCNSGECRFKLLPKRKRPILPSQVCKEAKDHFLSAGFAAVPAKNISNLEGTTDLIVAGVQMFDGIIHRGYPVDERKMYAAQPCVRMQFKEKVASQDGISTSFVNVCTEKIGLEFSEHLQVVDQWCGLLSKLGMHMNDFVLVRRIARNDWGTGEFPAIELFFTYAGLELGDASYMHVPQSSRPWLSLSDIGFGLERIVWALNKLPSYFDCIMPIAAVGDREKHDACRTLALLSLCGVQAGNKGPGLQFRRLCKTVSDKYYAPGVFQMLPFYFDYWAQFLEPAVAKDAAASLVRLEVERFVNLGISEALKLPPPRSETTEDYLHRLVYTCGADACELRRVARTCYKEQ